MSEAPTVAVWRGLWLPRSETFVRNQVASLSRWRPYLVGLRRLPDGLDVVPDLAPYGSGPVSDLVLRADRATGLRRHFDAALRRERVRVIHAHFGTGGVEVLPISRRTGIPLVVTFHGFDATSHPRGREKGHARYREALEELFAHASRLIAVSDFIAGRLLDLGAPEERVRVLPIGIPVDAPPGDGGRSGVVFAGRLVEVKGVADLIDAVALLPADLRASTPLRIAGSGPLEAPLRERAERAGVAAEFLGAVDSATVHELLATGAVFASPSRTSADGAQEGFGMVFLEAGLAGTPVLSYSHGGVPEAVVDGGTGLLAPEGDVPALSAALERLLRDASLRARLGAAGRARVLLDYDVRRCTGRLEDLYDEVVAETGGATA